MKTRGLVIGVVLVCACLMGAVQRSQFIGTLRTSGGDFLAEKDGRVVLVRTRDGAVPRFEGLQSVWRISAPHLQTAKGKLLAIDQSETGAKIQFAAEKSGTTNWVIEVTESTTPDHPKNGSIDERKMLEGTSKQTFRLSVFDGRHKGWYLSAEQPAEAEGQSKSPADEVIVRELQVTKDPKQALSFDYIDTTYRIIHK